VETNSPQSSGFSHGASTGRVHGFAVFEKVAGVWCNTTDMKRPFSATVRKEGKWFVTHCLDVDIASQGETPERALANLKRSPHSSIRATAREPLHRPTNNWGLTTNNSAPPSPQAARHLPTAPRFNAACGNLSSPSTKIQSNEAS